MYPIVKLSDAVLTQTISTIANHQTPSVIPATPPATTPPPTMPIAAKMAKYDQMFDDMDEVGKAESIVMLLETLPTIKELRSYLVHQGGSSQTSLRTWIERVSPAALGILRWIIASNRSCIFQVDVCPGQTNDEVIKSKIRLDQKCSNVDDNYVQFRFAQGAPDKEQRFLNALKAQQAHLDPKYPTMFAWHGSPLANWHSIIRHGLDFKETLHGRAYGHGVYHAQDQHTSVGYAGAGAVNWPGSALAITSAMSLNEIVNCPQQFVSSNPFIVVQHIDWIQCRYLFVQTSGSSGQDGNNRRYVHVRCSVPIV
jgi:ubiquitin-conjugating enzyme E2 Q